MALPSIASSCVFDSSIELNRTARNENFRLVGSENTLIVVRRLVFHGPYTDGLYTHSTLPYSVG